MTQSSVMKRFIESIETDSNSSKIVVLMEGFDKQLCLTPDFELLLRRAFILSSSIGGESYKCILNIALKKFKCFRLLDLESWNNLTSHMSQDLYGTLHDLGDIVNVVSYVVEAATGVDLSEPCDSDEIAEAIPIVLNLLKPTKNVLSCSKKLKQLAKLTSQASGCCSLEYFDLDENRQIRSFTNMEAMLSTDRDPEAFLSFRDRHVAQLDVETCEELSTQCVECYLQWLDVATSILKLLLNAYPVSARVQDFIDGRYVSL